MRKLPILAASLLLALPAPLLAQDAPATQMPGEATTAAPATAQDGASVVAAIGAASMVAADIENIPAVQTVTIVEVSQLPDADPQAIDEAVTANSDAVETLRSTLAANQPVADTLASQGVQTEDVVAADIDAGGNLTVYTHRVA